MLSLLAVIFRLHIRCRVVREPGIDDLFIVLAAILKLVGLAAFFGGTATLKSLISGQNTNMVQGLELGFGKHLIYIIDILEPTMIWFYVANAAYVMTTVSVKLSLCCQYLRLFRAGYRRPLVIGLLSVVSLWGAVFTFMALFPCFPVSGFWNKTMYPPAKCYGFGYRTIQGGKDTFFAFSGSNMVLDMAIFIVPLTEYFKLGLKRKQILAMTGLFSFGSM